MSVHRRENSQRRFSRDGFVPLGQNHSGRDVTVDIPLATVPSHGQTGFRGPNSHTSDQNAASANYEQSSNEKTGFFHRQQGRRRIPRNNSKGSGKDKYGEEAPTITTMGKIYDKILNFSIVTRYFLYVLPLAAIIAVPIIVAATVNPKLNIGGVSVIRLFAWLEVVWLSLWISKIFAKMIPSIFEFLSGIVSSGTRKYALAITALERPLSIAGWALVCLVTFKPITVPPAPKTNSRTPPPPQERDWQGVMYHVLWAAFIATIIFLIEKVLVQVVSISYHRKQFNDKIKQSKHNIYLISLLYDASRTLFPAYGNEFAEEDYIINDSIMGGSKSGGHQRSGSVTPMKLLRDVGRVGDKITSAFGNIAHEITGKQVFNPNSAHSVVVEALEKKRSCEALAKRIWMSFVVEGRDALYEDDIIEVLGDQRREEAVEAFSAIDRDGNGDISLDEMIMTVVDFSRDRYSIANSMHDVDQAINVLDSLLCFVVFIIIVFIFVAFLNSSFTTTLATAGTALLSMSFVFAATAQEVLGSCIFLFVKHPYDVGDRVDINDTQLVVEHISLLFCVFRRVDTHKTVQVPNIMLNSNWIENVSRSRAMRERMTLFISFGTTLEDIQALKNEMQKFVLDKENSRDFQSDVDVEVTGIAEMNKLELRVEIKHKSNWSNETLRAQRRSKFMCALVLALRKVPIYGPGGGDAALGDRANPSYSVAINDLDATKNKEDFATTKEAGRLFPSKPADPTSPSQSDINRGVSSSSDFVGAKRSGSRPSTHTVNRPTTHHAAEAVAVDALNNRRPTADSARDEWDTYREDMDAAAAAEDAAARTEAYRRGADVEQVRGLLRRESTRGRRKAADSTSPTTQSVKSSAPSATGAMSPPSIPMPTVVESAPNSSGNSAPSLPPPAITTQPPSNNNTPQPTPYGAAPPLRSEDLPSPPPRQYGAQQRPQSPADQYQPYRREGMNGGPMSPPPLAAHPAVRYQSPRPNSPTVQAVNGSPTGSPQRTQQANAFAERARMMRQQAGSPGP
ncbi:MAG: hypothetical protein M4579_002773, partial [Chaenotheca gracillima]